MESIPDGEGVSTLQEYAELVSSFRKAWEQNRRPELEEILADVPDSQRTHLFYELFRVEAQARIARGDGLSSTEYSLRFPEYAEAIHEFICHLADSDNQSLVSTVKFLPEPEEQKQVPVQEPVDLSTNLPRAELGRFRLLNICGRGGFGEVWRAFDPELGRVVAVKQPRQDRPWVHPESILEEARRVAQLNLSGVAQVYDVGQDGGVPYIVSEYLPGGSLEAVLHRERVPVVRAVRLVAQVAETLHQAHLQNLIHRDIKPGNILLDGQGNPRVADFGLAITEQESYQKLPKVVGTYAYMAPEQARGDSHRVDSRTDVYSLGGVLYHLLTGRRMILGKDPQQLLQEVLHREPRPPRSIDDSIPVELERICLKCLEKEPSRRYSTAADLASDLRAWLKQSEIPSASARVQPASSDRVSGWMVAGLGIILAGVALGLFVWLGLNNRGKGELPVNPDIVAAANPLIPVPPEAPGNEVKPEVKLPGPDEREFERGVRNKILDRPLKQLLWPVPVKGSNLDPDYGLEYLQAVVKGQALLKAGEIAAPDYTIEVMLDQPEWHGGFALFYGLHPHPEGGFECDMLGFVVIQHQFGLPKCRFDRIYYRLNADYTKLDSHSRTSVPVPYPTGKQELVLVFKDHQLLKATWGNVELIQMGVDTRPDVPILSCEGAFGFYFSNCTTQVSNFRIQPD